MRPFLLVASPSDPQGPRKGSNPYTRRRIAGIMVAELQDGRLKAELISMGRLRVPRELLEGYRLSRSTAGPGAGSTSLALAWEGSDGREHHVKMALAPEGSVDAPVELVRSSTGNLELRRRDGRLLVAGVWLLPIVMHAPDQAFISLDGVCIHECAFCTTHLMEGRRLNSREPGRWVELVVEAHRRRPFHALAITGVASADHEAMMADYEAIIRGVLAELPHLHVGVEPYVRGPEDIARLKRAGASEIKINVQSPVQEILGRVCPGWSLETQYGLLEEAVRVFGRGHVTTNILVGLGETDSDVEGSLDRLAAMGVIPSVRGVRVNDLNAPALEGALGHPVEGVDVERHLRLARMLRDSLDRQDLKASSLQTMCHRCGCCDLEPGQDV